VVTKCSGQAQTAVISRPRLSSKHGERTTGKDQGQNKSSTNRLLGQTDSDSRIRRVESFPSTQAARNAVTKSSGRRDSLVPQTRTGRPSFGQTMKESDMVESPRVAIQRQVAIAAVGRAHQVLVNEQLQAPPIIEQALPHASNGDLRTVRGQTVKESAMAESPRVALQTQVAICGAARAHQVLVNGSQILPLRRCLQEKSPRPSIRRLGSVQKPGALDVDLPDRAEASPQSLAVSPSSPP
jgi:hypothetical protein